jgi:hypothetical protein
MNSFCQAKSGSETASRFANLWPIVTLTALIVTSAVAPAFAQEPDQPKARSNSKLNAANDKAATEAAPLPECLAALKLSEPQQTQAKEIIRKYDAELDLAWQQFGAKYMETVRTEVSLLAAVEDKLTEPQRTQVREQRRKMANVEKKLAATSARSNQALTKAPDAVSGELTDAGISLTEEQEAAADEIHHKYASHLRSLNRDIQGIHMRLVSLEADKLVELEKLLTPEQLTQLREGRQTTNGAPNVTATRKTSTTTE